MLCKKSISNAEYHSGKGISKSGLFKIISKSPMHFYYDLKNPPEKTQALTFGSAFHKYVLEESDFSKEFVIQPIIDRRTREGKEQWNEFVEKSKGKEIITQTDLEIIREMKESIYNNKHAVKLLSGEHEQSYYWNDDLTDELCKCRPDSLLELENQCIITDLKTCQDASTDSFMRDVVKYGYDMQAAMYCAGVEAVTGKECSFVFVAVEKSPPYATNVLQADIYIKRRGYDLFREAIGIYHKCKQTENWYGYNGFSGMINNLSLPKWLAKEYE